MCRRACIDVLLSNTDPDDEDDVICLKLKHILGHSVRASHSTLKPSACA